MMLSLALLTLWAKPAVSIPQQIDYGSPEAWNAAVNAAEPGDALCYLRNNNCNIFTGTDITGNTYLTGHENSTGITIGDHITDTTYTSAQNALESITTENTVQEINDILLIAYYGHKDPGEPDWSGNYDNSTIGFYLATAVESASAGDPNFSWVYNVVNTINGVLGHNANDNNLDLGSVGNTAVNDLFNTGNHDEWFDNIKDNGIKSYADDIKIKLDIIEQNKTEIINNNNDLTNPLNRIRDIVNHLNTIINNENNEVNKVFEPHSLENKNDAFTQDLASLTSTQTKIDNAKPAFEDMIGADLYVKHAIKKVKTKIEIDKLKEKLKDGKNK